MALFKISKGLKANLPLVKTAGYCWYTTDDSIFYVDYEDEDGLVQRQALNAKDAETITGASLSTILNSSNVEIPTSKAVLDALNQKANLEHSHIQKMTTDEYNSLETVSDSVLYVLTDFVDPDAPIEISAAKVEEMWENAAI